MSNKVSSLAAAVAAVRRGEMIVLVDSPNRENEGDLVMAAECVTPNAVNFMATHGRGLICVPMRQGRLAQLRIPPMVARGTDAMGTALHVGVDHAGETSTGISARDRAATIRALADPSSRPSDFARPGHVFPLAARDGGVLERPGHTEAALEITRRAGHSPAAMICEIVGDDGEMARLPALVEFAERHGLRLLMIEEIVNDLLQSDEPPLRVSSAQLPVNGATFDAVAYHDRAAGNEHLALVLGDSSRWTNPLVRLHSECLTGDVFGSRRCDCGAQLELAVQMIAHERSGILVYLRGHEGRGIGLVNKLEAYRLQDQGHDTIEANLQLGLPADARHYDIAARILKDLGVQTLRLLSNNPDKRASLGMHGLTVTEAVPLRTGATPENLRYLATKRDRLGHHLEPDVCGAPMFPSSPQGAELSSASTGAG